MEPANNNCSVQPNFVFLIVTLLITAVATATLCTSIMTDHWEYISWNADKLEAIEKQVAINTASGMKLNGIEWLLDGQVARIVIDVSRPRSFMNESAKNESIHSKDNVPALFLVPIHGGIWQYCISLNATQYDQLDELGFPKFSCMKYLKLDTTKTGGLKADQQHRMQNLSISCAMVCLIILGSSALTGTFGVAKHQISAVLITGVMYLLAAVFATFSLTIIYYKKGQSQAICINGSTTENIIEGVVASTTALEKTYSIGSISKYFDARIYTAGWSLYLGWGGVGMCILVNVLWILLSKIMRYNPLNTVLALL